jgi:hypothetical protein
MKFRYNKKEHIRSTWSSLLLNSLLNKGIHVEEIFEYGWYIGSVTQVIWAGSLHHLHLLLVFIFQTCQPIQPPLPLACMNSLNSYKRPLWEYACLYSHTANSLFPPVACVFMMTQFQCAIFAILFGIFPIRLQEVQLVEVLHYNTRDSGFDSQQGPWKFYSDLFLLSAFIRWSPSHPNRIEYQWISLDIKWNWCIELTTIPS